MQFTFLLKIDFFHKINSDYSFSSTHSFNPHIEFLSLENKQVLKNIRTKQTNMGKKEPKKMQRKQTDAEANMLEHTEIPYTLKIRNHNT